MEIRAGQVVVHYVEACFEVVSRRRCRAAAEVIGGTAYLLIGHSAGAYDAQAMGARRPAQVAGLALVCPLLQGLRDERA
jgi:pimeloyl-ACP methyl ester carboxylesterase